MYIWSFSKKKMKQHIEELSSGVRKWIRLGLRLENPSMILMHVKLSQAWEKFIAHARPKGSFDTSPLKDLSALHEFTGRMQRIVTMALMLG